MSVRPFHHQRPLVSIALAYGLGVWAGVSFVYRPLLYGAAFAAAVAATILLPRAGRRRTAGFMACFLFLGMLLGGWQSHPSLPPEGKYRVTGVMACDAVLREDGTAAGYLDSAWLQTEGSKISVGKLYWTYTPDSEAPFLPKEGDQAAFDAVLYHPDGQVNPYGFDFRMFLLQKGVRAGVTGAGNAELISRQGRGLASVLYHAKEKLAEQVRLIFGEDSALPEALLLGQREQLPQETKRGFSDAGTAHLLAVSGLHAGLLAGLLMIPLRRLLDPKRRLLALGTFLFFYCALLNFSAPVLRASVLIMIGAWRRTVRRTPDPLTALCAAFLLILLFRPLDLFSASFQLSFCAVLGMIGLSPFFARLDKRSFGGTVLLAWQATVSATLGVFLPTVQTFHRFSVIGLLVNPFACAFFAILLPVYLLVTAAGCIWLPGGVWLARLLNPVTRGVLDVVTRLGRLPFSTVQVPMLPWYCVLAIACALILLTRFTVWPRKKKLLCGILALAFSFGVWRLTLCREVQYIQLAMGQADAAVLADGTETAVIDAGSYGGDLASYLLSTGRKTDHLILTHLHTDHCAGVAQLLENEVPIGRVYLPEGAEEQQVDEACLLLLDELKNKEIPIVHLSAGDTISLPRSTLTVTWPVGGTVPPGQDANRYCLCLLCDLDGVKLLACSDIPGAYERYAALDADLLKAAHHGSKSSSGEGFLKAVSPQAILLTSNRLSARLPNPDTLKRLQATGALIYETGHTGAVTVTVWQGQAHIATFINEKEQP
ncbi:MAG: ComEC/Rec2 family competence protein [Clostridia bacterium]|nr:ComEC/Rec2 family competence protein [Clostridia bacterium]